MDNVDERSYKSTGDNYQTLIHLVNTLCLERNVKNLICNIS